MNDRADPRPFPLKGVIADLAVGYGVTRERAREDGCEEMRSPADCMAKRVASLSAGTHRLELQYSSRSGRISCRMVVAISSIDLVVVESQRMPSRRIMASASATSLRQFSSAA
jgi:hypothetical protein